MARAIEHYKLVAEQESTYEATVLTDSLRDRGPGLVVVLPSGPSTPPRTAVAPASSSPPAALPRPAVSGRAIRRLDLQMENAQALESTQPVDTADSDFSSIPASPDSCCSQRRLQEYEDQIKVSTYPEPPDAPRKDQHYSESESEAESQPWRPLAKIFRNGKLMYHKKFKGAVTITYVNTRLYEGGHDDYYEAHGPSDLRRFAPSDLRECCARRLLRGRHLLDAHKIPRIPRW
jgi:hypothetical protein